MGKLTKLVLLCVGLIFLVFLLGSNFGELCYNMNTVQYTHDMKIGFNPNKSFSAKYKYLEDVLKVCGELCDTTRHGEFIFLSLSKFLQ